MDLFEDIMKEDESNQHWHNATRRTEVVSSQGSSCGFTLVILADQLEGKA